MKAADLSICPTTSRELSGDLGGVVASNVVSVADLKWIICSGRYLGRPCGGIFRDLRTIRPPSWGFKRIIFAGIF